LTALLYDSEVMQTLYARHGALDCMVTDREFDIRQSFG